MKRILLSLALLLCACDSKPEEKAAPAETRPAAVAGGWTAGPVDPEARGVAAVAWTFLKQPVGTIASVDSVETQVVAGLNYRLRMTLSDKSRWEVVVWKKLDGTMEATAIKQLESAP